LSARIDKGRSSFLSFAVPNAAVSDARKGLIVEIRLPIEMSRINK